MIIESRGYARAGLIGNPSDGYFGKTIAVIIKNFHAEITLFESHRGDKGASYQPIHSWALG